MTAVEWEALCPCHYQPATWRARQNGQGVLYEEIRCRYPGQLRVDAPLRQERT